MGPGDKFRTGASAGPGTLEEQWKAGAAQKEAAGPSVMSFNRIIQGSQGTMGIVTWASARCELLPELEESFLVGSAQLSKITETLHWLIRLRLVDVCLALNNSNVAELMAHTVEEYKKIKDSLPPWVLLFNISAYDYLAEDRMKGQILDMQDTFNASAWKHGQSLSAASPPSPSWTLHAVLPESLIGNCAIWVAVRISSSSLSMISLMD